MPAAWIGSVLFIEHAVQECRWQGSDEHVNSFPYEEIRLKFFVGVTDGNWFNYLARNNTGEINFWRPSAQTLFRAIEPGSPFLFKLHSPNNFIVGGGHFVGSVRLPLSRAWRCFETNNGAATFDRFKNSLMEYRRKNSADLIPDPEICCIILNEPFFFERSEWIKVPSDWASNIVSGKTYGTEDSIGQDLWAQVQAVLDARAMSSATRVASSTALYTVSSGEVPGKVFGNQYLRTARLGQGAFRTMITEEYKRRCCITGESTLPVLEAAHIRPVAQNGEHKLVNGLLLRADMHILFDQGLIGVTPDYKVQISSEIKNLYHNGVIYYSHHGQLLKSLPTAPELQPAKEALEWHMDTKFIR